jgi:ketopantoate reductase (EC 1.1.1.169)
MENAKLFLNLIGMAAATAQGSGEPTAAVGNTDVGARLPSRKTTADQGWRDKEIFKKEMAVLREFVLAVNAVRGGFAGKLGGYPVKLLARLALLPVWLLAPWRGVLAGAVAKGRNRLKDLSEIDYYNGEVVRLGKKANVPTPVNEAIIAKARALKRKI